MRGADFQEQRRFARVHKSDAMMQHDLVQLKFLRRRVRDQSQSMFRHLYVRFVIDPLNLTTIFQFSNNAKEIDHRAGLGPKIF